MKATSRHNPRTAVPGASGRESAAPPPPVPQGQVGLHALRALLQERSLLAALAALHREMGDIFQLPLPGFDPVVLVGPQANRFLLVESRDDVRWRTEGDPVTQLLRQGVLVVDGAWHDELRGKMNPSLHRRMFGGYVETMWRTLDWASEHWADSGTVDMLVDMRRVALTTLIQTLFGADVRPHIRRLWKAVLKTLSYISPGAWLLWRGIPRPGYRRALEQMDAYLYEIIAARRQHPANPSDLLGSLITVPGYDDGLIRDQLLTMLIAGHDTNTALLAWSLYLLGQNPGVMAQAKDEVDQVLGSAPPQLETIGGLKYLDAIVNESLRLYPPIHIGNRTAARDLEFQGYRIPAGKRVVYSIYLSHRHPAYWDAPDAFRPERFMNGGARDLRPYVFVPFGGGPRNCIGAAYGQMEARVVLARILQRYELRALDRPVHPHMGATLEPRPGVLMTVRSRPIDAEARG